MSNIIKFPRLERIERANERAMHGRRKASPRLLLALSVVYLALLGLLAWWML